MEYRRHVVTDTGAVLLIRKVSPLLNQELKKKFPPPAPPTSRVDYGDGDVREEPNPSDPAHQQAMAEWQDAMEERARMIFVKLGVAVEWTDEKRARVQEVRETMALLGVDLDPDDKMVYVSHVAIGSEQDYQELVQAIMTRSQPTEAAIAEAVETFPG
jgi:hypothetical protein